MYAGTKRWIWISTVIATTLLITCAFILCLAIKKRKHVLQGIVTYLKFILKHNIFYHLIFLIFISTERKRKETTKKLSLIDDFGNNLSKGHRLKVFDYTLVVAATNEFSSENKLGQGGFGPVYKVIETTEIMCC